VSNRRQKRKCPCNGVGAMPKCLCVLGAAVWDGFKVGRASVVTECLPGIHEHDVVGDFAVKSR
jgi:hypothetical protein